MMSGTGRFGFHRRKPGKRSLRWRRAPQQIFLLFLILTLFSPPLTVGQARSLQQASTPEEKAVELLDQLTPQERVGQLFLIAFEGNQITTDSPIYDLIANHFIGGVVLKEENGNFAGDGGPAGQARALTREIQNTRWASSKQPRIDPYTSQTLSPSFVPLFIAIAQEGDGSPYDELLEGMTPLPSQMAVGATWQPALAEKVGNVLGEELTVLGINMLLGPSLDVLENPKIGKSGDLGTRTFGGDPFWVAEMGRAYIKGIHTGSHNQIAVIAKHFPGFGSSDRLPEEEVATIFQSLEQLRNFDLVPFFAVTGKSETSETTADGLLASHIRYQGFQGNIRATTRPFSFDPQAFDQLMNQEEFKQWRNNGGLMVSDDLGSPAIRGYYDMNNQTFDASRVALSAFQTANDLLYIADFASANEPDSYTAAVRTLELFTQRYRADANFAQKVDQSVLRILTLKYNLYDNFQLGQVLASSAQGLGEIGDSSDVTFEVALQSATLISPNLNELDEIIPEPPDLQDRIVFITDTSPVQSCSSCPSIPTMQLKGMEETVLRLYGPQAGGQIAPNHLISYSFQDLQEMLAAGRGETQLETDLRQTDWIVFSMLGGSGDPSAYIALDEFLSQRPDLIQQKRLIAFAFNAPYYLDATNISKLSAYYGLYSKVPKFLDVAAYLLFREIRPVGAPPVSVPGVYNLNQALFPTPDQVIQLEFGMEITNSQTAGTPEPVTNASFKIGDQIVIKTGVISDHNGHPVPDGTPVEFIFNDGGETRQTEVTVDGSASTLFQVNRPGIFAVRAESEPAKESSTLNFDVAEENTTGVPPTSTDQPVDTPTPTIQSTSTPVPVPVSAPIEPIKQPEVADWIVALMVTSAIAWVTYRLAAQAGQIRWGVRGAFLAFIGGLLAYSYLLLKMPGSQELLHDSVSKGVLLSVLMGTGFGLLAAWLWKAVISAVKESTGKVK